MPQTWVDLPDPLLSEIDTNLEKWGYKNRSELMREAIRDFVSLLKSGAAKKQEGEVLESSPA